MSSEPLDSRLRVIADGLRSLAAVDPGLQIFGASSHRWASSAPLSEEAAAAIEREHGIALPAEYRRFVTTVARGGAGPYYGIAALDEQLASPPPDPPQLATAFDPDARSKGEALYHGTVVLADQGCGSTSVLVVTGSHAGEVWTLGESMTIPEAPSFLDWLERWLADAAGSWAADTVPRVADGIAEASLLVSDAMRGSAVESLARRARDEQPEFALYADSLPSPAEATRALGFLAASKGDFGEAERWLARAAAVETKEPEARAALDHARLARLRGDSEGVVASTAEGLAVPKSWANTVGLLLRHRIEALDALGRADDAIEAAEALAARTYFVHGAHYDLATRHLARGDWSAVETVLLRAASRPPSLPRDLKGRAAALAVLEPFAIRLEAEGRPAHAAQVRALVERFPFAH